MALGTMINKVSALYSPDRESEYTHAGIIISDKYQTFESLWRVESKHLLEEYNGKKVLIAEPIGVTEKQIDKSIYKVIQKHNKQVYPFHRLFLHVFNLAQFIHWKRLVCSELVAKYLFYLDIRHHRYFGTTPDMLCDEIRWGLNKERTGPKYNIIFEGIL
jgi:hypothetical protein